MNGYLGSETADCSGTALSKRVVVTAAHCVSSWPEDKKILKNMFYYDFSKDVYFDLYYDDAQVKQYISGKVIAVGNTIKNFGNIPEKFQEIINALERGVELKFDYDNDWAIVILDDPIESDIQFPKIFDTEKKSRLTKYLALAIRKKSMMAKS